MSKMRKTPKIGCTSRPTSKQITRQISQRSLSIRYMGPQNPCADFFRTEAKNTNEKLLNLIRSICSTNLHTKRNALWNLYMDGKLLRSAAAAVPIFMKALWHDDVVFRNYAKKVLTAMGPKFAPPNFVLINWLQHPSFYSLKGYALAMLEERDAALPFTSILIKLLKNKEESVRRYALRNLAKLGPAATPAVTAIIKVLENDSHIENRFAAAWTLGKIGLPAKQAIPALTRALKYGGRKKIFPEYTYEEYEQAMKATVRYYAAWALGIIGKTSQSNYCPDISVPLASAVSELREQVKNDWSFQAKKAARVALKRILGDCD